MSKENLKKGKITPEEIKSGEAEQMAGLLRKEHDHYKGGLKKSIHPGSKMTIIEDKKIDPYRGISRKSKLEGDVDNTTAFDKKAYQQLRDE